MQWYPYQPLTKECWFVPKGCGNCLIRYRLVRQEHRLLVKEIMRRTRIEFEARGDLRSSIFARVLRNRMVFA